MTTHLTLTVARSTAVEGAHLSTVHPRLGRAHFTLLYFEANPPQQREQPRIYSASSLRTVVHRPGPTRVGGASAGFPAHSSPPGPMPPGSRRLLCGLRDRSVRLSARLSRCAPFRVRSGTTGLMNAAVRPAAPPVSSSPPRAGPIIMVGSSSRSSTPSNVVPLTMHL